MAKDSITTTSEDEEYLKEMGVKDAGDIAAKIVSWMSSREEDDYYAIKYGRRMIEALVAVECRKKGAIW